jgi:hypothetical protein
MMEPGQCDVPISVETARRVIYLYGFVRAETAIDLQGIETLAIEGVAAVFGRVWGNEWDSADTENNLQDTDWLLPRVWQHGQVVEAVNSQSTVLPARFGAVFTSEVALEDFMALRVGEIDQFLERITGHEEWSLKSYLDLERAEAWLTASDPELAELRNSLSANRGKRYFQEKRLHASVEKLAGKSSRSAAAGVHDQLRPLAVDVRELRLQVSTETKHEMIRHDAWLVPQCAIDEFHGQLERLQAEHLEQGLVLESSGPWPPYSFTPYLGESSP